MASWLQIPKGHFSVCILLLSLAFVTIYFNCSIINKEYYISFRATTQGFDNAIPYSVIMLSAVITCHQRKRYPNITDCIPCAVGNTLYFSSPRLIWHLSRLTMPSLYLSLLTLQYNFVLVFLLPLLGLLFRWLGSFFFKCISIMCAWSSRLCSLPTSELQEGKMRNKSPSESCGNSSHEALIWGRGCRNIKWTLTEQMF